MASPQPKALVFDIGGVCVVSPFRAILDYENAHSIPPGYVNLSISRSKPNGAWHRLERGELPLDAAFFAAFKADLQRPAVWAEHCSRAKLMRDEGVTPPLPDIDAEWLYWEMMRISRQPDPYMFPALKKLKASGRYLLAALSNTVVFPNGHPYNDPPDQAQDVKAVFDVFVSSAHVGLRKPDPPIYQLAMKMMRDKGLPGGGELRPQDVVFLDDIGENLRTGKAQGWQTIKVMLGNTKEAVKELERITGLQLLDDAPRL